MWLPTPAPSAADIDSTDNLQVSLLPFLEPGLRWALELPPVFLSAVLAPWAPWHAILAEKAAWPWHRATGLYPLVMAAM